MEKWKVLLVDDEPEFTSALAERLSLRGINAKTAVSGEEALRLIESDPPDVVVSDLMMPGLGGVEVLQRVKQRYPKIQVILLTGMSCKMDADEGKRLGAFDCLIKPLNIDELIKTIHQAIVEVSV